MNLDTSRCTFSATWEADISWKTVLHNSFSVGDIRSKGPTLPLEVSTHRLMTTINATVASQEYKHFRYVQYTVKPPFNVSSMGSSFED
jgi:hypothetical protein